MFFTLFWEAIVYFRCSIKVYLWQSCHLSLVLLATLTIALFALIKQEINKPLGFCKTRRKKKFSRVYKKTLLPVSLAFLVRAIQSRNHAIQLTVDYSSKLSAEVIYLPIICDVEINRTYYFLCASCGNILNNSLNVRTRIEYRSGL